MKRKVIWLVVSCLMALSLLMASCAPAVTEEEEVVPPEKEEVVTEEEVAPPVEGPTYGGVINLGSPGARTGFDEGFDMPHACGPLMLTHEELMVGDWAKGPAGTGEVTWRVVAFNPAVESLCLMESWERPDEETAIFHIRKGVHWHDKPPVNGRELTADDIVFSIERAFLSDLLFSVKTRIPAGSNIESVEATDKWTVVVKCPAAAMNSRLRNLFDIMRVMAPEAGEEYVRGGRDWRDYRHWEDCIGTGPFIIVDHVDAGATTFVKNPNYWGKDPVHPENTVPYVDGVKFLAIPDASTRLAALRTGKIETSGVSWEEAPVMWVTNPELKWLGGLGGKGGNLIGMRVDDPELPFQDIRVRRALAMGVDRQLIADEFYGGSAEVFAFPILPVKAFSDMFTPLDELSESIQEQYEFKPEKARQLLAEAGYPNGFKTPMICGQPQADLASLLKEYWADIGVEVEIQTVDQSVARGLMHTHGGMFIGGAPADDPQILMPFATGQFGNFSVVSDPYVDALFKDKLEGLGTMAWEECCQVMKEEAVPYVLEKCWYIDLPATIGYTFWQPWLMGYHGEQSLGFRNANNWTMYVWLDQELKKEMTGR